MPRASHPAFLQAKTSAGLPHPFAGLARTMGGMTDLILHQYQLSPFSEKIRRVLAFKGLAWKAVRAPAVMPKPDLIPLTGGYRKIPVLQVGNHVYCDTARICQLLELRKPKPTLYPTPLAAVFAEWADTALFESSVPMIMRPTRFDDLIAWLTPQEQQTMIDDRRAMRKDALRLTPGPKTLVANFAIYVQRLEDGLASHDYLLGTEPCIADFSAYHNLWIVSRVTPEKLASFTRVRAWMERIAKLPDPEITEFSSEDALRVARDADPKWTATEPFADPTGLQAEQRVNVRATDYGREETIGVLTHSSASEIVLRRTDDRAGTVYVHFPRLGFEAIALKD
jgi:glutathione S-transferase